MEVEGGGGYVLWRGLSSVGSCLEERGREWDGRGYLGGMESETTAFGPGVEARVGDGGARDCFLWEV